MKLTSAIGQVLDTRYIILLEELHSYVEALAPQLQRQATFEVLKRLDLEQPSIMNALDSAATLSDAEPQLLALNLLVQLEYYLNMRAMWPEILAWATQLQTKVMAVYPHLASVLSNLIGSAQSALGDHKQAVEYYQQALDQAQLSGQTAENGLMHGNLGVALWSLGQLDESLYHMRQVLDYHFEHGDLHGAARTLANLAQIHFDRGDHETALELSFDALRLATRLEDEVLQAQFTAIVAVHMMGNGLLEQADPVFKQATFYLNQLHDEIGLALNNLNHALLYSLREQYELARYLLLTCQATFERYDMPDAQQAHDLLAMLPQP